MREAARSVMTSTLTTFTARTSRAIQSKSLTSSSW